MRALALPLLLVGCVGATSTVPDGPIAPILLDAGGIDVIGTGQRIDFGRHGPGVVQTMTRLQGRAPDPVPCPDPGVTAVSWDDGLTLVFHDGAFAGWGTRNPGQSFEGRANHGQVCIGPSYSVAADD